MIEELAYDVTAQEAPFAVYAEPPWLLHLSGELDLCTAPALTKMLEGPTVRGGTIGLDLADLSYMDSSGLHVILNTVRLLGERGRVVLFDPSPVVRRLLELCELDGMIDVGDQPSSAQLLD
jgi:anti-sigma B factor antagonist